MTQAAAATAPGRARRWLPWAGGLLGLIALAWVMRGFDFTRFRSIVVGADLRLLALVPLSILAEQLVRAWKWRQLLHPLRPVGVVLLFGTIMAGYLLAIRIPFGFGTVARSWLVARRDDLKLASVLATVALDRLTDGIVFACLIPLALFSVVSDDPGGDIRTGLVLGGTGSFLLFATVLLALVAYRRGALGNSAHGPGRFAALLGRLPQRFVPAVQRFATTFAEGVVWSRDQRGGVVTTPDCSPDARCELPPVNTCMCRPSIASASPDSALSKSVCMRRPSKIVTAPLPTTSMPRSSSTISAVFSSIPTPGHPIDSLTPRKVRLNDPSISERPALIDVTAEPAVPPYHGLLLHKSSYALQRSCVSGRPARSSDLPGILPSAPNPTRRSSSSTTPWRTGSFCANCCGRSTACWRPPPASPVCGWPAASRDPT